MEMKFKFEGLDIGSLLAIHISLVNNSLTVGRSAAAYTT